MILRTSGQSHNNVTKFSPSRSIYFCTTPLPFLFFSFFFLLRLLSFACLAKVRGRINSVGAKGFKLAKGAVITFAERVNGTLARNSVSFAAGSVKASKGVITVAVDNISTTETHFLAKGGRVKTAAALDTVTDIVWS